MRNQEKWVALFCAVIMLIYLPACGSGKPSEDADTQTENTAAVNASFDPMAKYEPAIDFTTVVSLSDAMQNYIGAKSDVLENNNWINGYKNDLGINIKYLWSVPQVQYEQKLNAQIAANDLPDIMSVTAVQLKTLVDSEMVYDMTKVFADYATPFTKKMMEDDNNVAITQCTFDGKLMALPNVNGNKDGVNMLWIRQDWLDKTGREAPKNVDELVELARIFTEEDPDQNQKDDTYGIAVNNTIYTGGLNDLTGFFECFGTNPGGWVEGQNGKAESGLIQPQIKQGLSVLAEMYKNGLLDKEFSTKDNSKVSEDLVAGRVGMFFGQHWVAFWPLLDSHNFNKEADWIAYPIPSVDGTPAKSMIHGSAGGFYAVNADCKYPEAAVKLLNYYYLKDCALSEGADTANFHITSSQAMQHPEAAYDWAIVKSFYPMQNLYIHKGVLKYFEGDKSVLENTWVKDNALQCETYEKDPSNNANFWSTYRWSGPQSAFSVVDYYDTDGLMLQDLYIMGSTDSMVQYNTTLNQLALESFTKIIMGSAPIDEFDNFVSQWKSLGGDKITEEVNAVIGR